MGIPYESWEQTQLAKWLDSIDVLWHHTSNEGKRHPRVGAGLKRAGTKPGVPDVLVYTCAANGRPTAIELKRCYDTAGPSDTQREWLDALWYCGYNVNVCNGHIAAIEYLKSLGYPDDLIPTNRSDVEIKNYEHWSQGMVIDGGF